MWITILAGGCDPAADGPARAAVEVETVRTAPVEPAVVASGIVEPHSRVSLSFEVPGVIERLHVAEGDVVEEGARVASLDRRDLERAVRAARADLDRARARVREARLRLEAARPDAPRAERAGLDVVRAEEERAALALEAARDRLARGELVAPFGATVERRLLAEHEYAAPGNPVAVLAEVDRVWVRADVSAADAARLRVGSVAWVGSPGQGRRLRGRLARIERAATGTASLAVEVFNPERRLAPGADALLEFPLGTRREAQSVPSDAVLRGPDERPFSFVIRGSAGDARVAYRAVSLGPVFGGRVVIASGLAPGDRVITRGQHLVTAGDRVRVVAREY